MLQPYKVSVEDGHVAHACEGDAPAEPVADACAVRKNDAGK